MSEDIKKPIVLRVYKNSELQTIKQFIQEQIVIGQSPDVQLVLKDESVSIIHAAIERRDSGYFICDLGSERGTQLNGQNVLDAKIEDGDQVNIGDFKIEFYVGVPKPKAPPMPAPSVTAQEVTHLQPPPPPAAKSEPPPIEPPPALSVTPTTSSPVDLEFPTMITQIKPNNEVPPQEEKPKLPETTPPPIVAAPPPVEVKPIPEPKPIPMPAQPPVGMALKPVILTQTKTEKPRSAQGGLETYAQKPRVTAHKKKVAFAPESKYKTTDDFIKPSRGTVVEVLVAWRERIINTYHFSKPDTMYLGSHPDADIQIPMAFSKQRKVPLLKIDSRLLIMLTPEMSGELVKQGQTLNFSELIKQNRMVRNGNTYQIGLEQGELMKIELGELSIILRYVSEAPKPLVAPLVDLTASESVALVFAVVLVAILAIYNYLYTQPRPLEADAQMDDPPRQAVVIVKPPPREKIVASTPAPSPIATPPPVKSTPTPKKVEVTATKQPKKETVADKSKKSDPGKAAEAAPNKVKSPNKIVGIKQGGSLKTTDSPAAQIQSKPKKDMTKSGVFSVFGGGGKNNELSKETAGAGEIAGLANSATGRSGLNENREGEGLGTMYDTGKGGNGTAAVGRPDVKGGNGRGTGNSGYGSGGVGGGRQGVKIQPGGTEESFSGTIDREAIRRVIQQNLKAIRACYERQLNRKPDLFGKLVIEWDIGDAGRVMRAHVKSTELSDPEVGNCVVNHLKSWTFPTPPTNNEVTVSYPFFFSN